MGRASAFEVMMLELTNRFRLDPGSEFDEIVRNKRRQLAHDSDTTEALRFFDVNMNKLERELGRVDPAQPLAWSSRLNDASRAHGEALIREDSQLHQLPGGPDILARIRDAGFDPAFFAENIYAYSTNADFAHNGLIVDWGPSADGMQPGRGHRVNAGNPAYRETGVSAIRERDEATLVGPWVVVQKFATEQASDPFLTGVVYSDRDRDDFYSIGEGVGGARFRVVGEGTARAQRAGDWAQEVSEGAHVVVISGRGVDGRIRARVTVERDNVKIDVVDGNEILTSGDLDLLSGGRSLTAIGVGDVALGGTGARDRLFGNAGANAMDGEGGNDVLRGGAGDDALTGGAGRDRLFGEDGDDVLSGGGQRDVLNGGRGNDTLEGGAGPDVLIGGAGADVFRFGGADGSDVVRDWQDGTDRIDLAPAGIGGFAEITVSAQDGDAVVSFAGTTITLRGAAGEIEASDFLFAGLA